MAGFEADYYDTHYKKNNSYVVLHELGINILNHLNNYEKKEFINIIYDIIGEFNSYTSYPKIYESPAYLEIFRKHLDDMLDDIYDDLVVNNINKEWNNIIKKYYPKDDIFKWSFPSNNKPIDEKKFWINYCNSKKWWN